MLRLVRAELFKSVAYRTPTLAALGAVALIALWATQILIRNAAYGEDRFLTSMLGITGAILPVMAFLIPMLLIEADTRAGDLTPVLVYSHRPRSVLIAKWAVSVFVGVCAVTLIWGTIVLPLVVFYGQDDALLSQLPILGRMYVLVVLWVSFSTACEVLTGYKGPWVVLGLLLWVHLIERLLGSALPGTSGMLAVPFRLADLWLRGEWQRIDPWGLSWAGAAPLAGYTILIAGAAVVSFIFYSDASGRAWGRKRVNYDRL